MKGTRGAQSWSGERSGLDLQGVVGAFERWRAERKAGQRIPRELWQAAVSLHPRHTVYQIARALRLDFVDLRDRVGGQRKKAGSKAESGPEFMQLPLATGGGVADLRVRVSDGRRVRISIRVSGAGTGAVVELLRQLWRGGA